MCSEFRGNIIVKLHSPPLTRVGTVEGLALAGEDGNHWLALCDRSVGFLPPEVIGKRRKNNAGLRLPFGGSRTVEALSGGATTDDQQQ